MNMSIRGFLLMSAAASTGMFIALAWFIPTSTLIELLNGVFLGLSIIVGVIWLPGLLNRYVRGGADSRVLQLFSGIGLIWLSIIVQRLLSAVYRYFDKPEGWADSIAWAIAVWIAMMGALLHVTASGTDDVGRLRNPERSILFIGVPLSVLVTVLVLLMRDHG